MSGKELRRAGILARVESGELKLVNAAVMMGVSCRPSKRLGQRYREEGAEGLKHRSVGRESNRFTITSCCALAKCDSAQYGSGHPDNY
jgi:Winged helix-turn helix